MTPDKSLAAEIEAATERERTRLIAWLFRHPLSTQTTIDREMTADALMADFIAPRLVEIAALQSRAFEDGARWMRQRAKLACLDYGEACLDRSIKLLHEHDLPRTGDAIGWADAATGCARLVEALPLQPEGERNA